MVKATQKGEEMIIQAISKTTSDTFKAAAILKARELLFISENGRTVYAPEELDSRTYNRQIEKLETDMRQDYEKVVGQEHNILAVSYTHLTLPTKA